MKKILGVKGLNTRKGFTHWHTKEYKQPLIIARAVYVSLGITTFSVHLSLVLYIVHDIICLLYDTSTFIYVYPYNLV